MMADAMSALCMDNESAPRRVGHAPIDLASIVGQALCIPGDNIISPTAYTPPKENCMRNSFFSAFSIKVLLAFCLTALLHPFAGAASQAADMPAGLPDPAEIESIAEQGFIYGLPIVMHYSVTYDYSVDKQSGQYKAPFNSIHNEAQAFTYKDTAFVTPNSDTPYSFACLDLRAEPVVLTVPQVPGGRYFSVQLVDANTFNFGYIGSRTTGNSGGSFLVAGPDWQGAPPKGMRVFRSSTQFALALYRTQLFNPEDLGNVEKVQSGYAVQPLSAFLGQPAPAALPLPNFPDIDQNYATPKFFGYLAFALQFAPAGPEEVDIRQKLSSIGVIAGKPFHFDALPEPARTAILNGIKKGDAKVNASIAAPGIRVNGWKMSSPFGDRSFYNGRWLVRAGAARAGIYGNNAEEAVYPMTRTLADGTQLDGGSHNYKITFAAGQLPPAKAFWSITMYDGNTELLIKNPIDRYLVNSPMLPGMRKNADGSLTVLIQRESPGKEWEANWLPAPNGPIYLVMRLYWPKTEQPSVLPLGKGQWQPPVVELNN